MISNSNPISIIFSFVGFLLLASIFGTVISDPTMQDSKHHLMTNQTFKPKQELIKLKRLRTYLRNINKPAVKTIQSSDGDLIDCVLSHLQPAFDHPHLKGMKPLNISCRGGYCVKALEALEEKLNQNTEHREAIEEATVWYNKVLGLRIECGQGVKFIFTNINANNPDDEYSFTIRRENDFVRTMREKFLDAVARGLTSQDQDTSTVSMPPLMSSISISSKDESSPQKAESQSDEYKRASRKLARGKRDCSAILSPISASSLRRSPRFKVKK